MKQLLFMLISILIGLNTLHAQEINPIEETTWNVIRERLFDGSYSKAFRFEEDIRIQLKGSPKQEDSLIFMGLINELDTLTEIVNVKLVDNNPNFIISILPPNDGLGLRLDQDITETTITGAEIDFNLRYLNSIEEKRRDYYYYTIRSLTVLFEPKTEIIGYGGIFYYQNIPNYVNFHAIDKDLIRKLYSFNFYEKLKENTIIQKGHLYYIYLRYEQNFFYFSTITGILLCIFVFYFLISFPVFLTNKSYYVKFTIVGLIISLTFFFVVWFFQLPRVVKYFPMPNFSFIKAILLFIVYSFLTINSMYLIENLFKTKKKKEIKKQLIIFFSTGFSVIITLIIIALIASGIKFTIGTLMLKIVGPNTNLLSIALIIAAIRVFYNFINYRIQSMVNQKDVELAKMKELKNQAELNALHSRINPHFLYNSLNSIASLAHINPDKTENMATALSELFRYSINKENKTFVTVEEELEMVKKYLEIEKTRFEDKLEYKIEAEENVKEKLIPKFLIQPLAENAIKHGLSKIKEVGKIIVEVKQLENDLVITIFDNGPDFPVEPVSGYGLQNLNDKLEIIYGSDAFINWENGENKHFKITIKNQFEG